MFQIHSDGVVERIGLQGAGLAFFRLFLAAFEIFDFLVVVEYFDFEIFENVYYVVEFSGVAQRFGEVFVDILVGEKTLFLGKMDKLPDFVVELLFMLGCGIFRFFNGLCFGGLFRFFENRFFSGTVFLAAAAAFFTAGFAATAFFAAGLAAAAFLTSVFFVVFFVAIFGIYF